MNNEIPPYVDDGSLRGQDDLPMRDFIAQGDRSAPSGRGAPFFSGREQEINAFRTVANRMLRGRHDNATLIFEGPPGAGKSALLDQIRADMESYPPVGDGGRRWLPVIMDGREACAPAEIMRAVDEAIGERLSEWLLDVKTALSEKSNVAERLLDLLGARDAGELVATAMTAAKRIVGERGVSAAGFSIGSGGTPHDPRTIRELAVRRGGKWRNWQIVLLIDEAQGISNRTVGADSGALTAIHQGIVRLPLAFCAFGLHGTMDALRAVNVSRETGGRHFRLGSLSNDESRTVVRRCFKQYGVTRGDAWENAILERSANWPQHLVAYLHAALSTLAAAAGADRDLGDVGRASLDAALALGDESRARYYKGRLDSLRRGAPWRGETAAALVAWIRTNPRDGISENDVVRFLAGPPLSLPNDELAAFHAAAKHAGVIESDHHDRVRIPIPSFAAHLLHEPTPSVAPERRNAREPKPR